MACCLGPGWASLNIKHKNNQATVLMGIMSVYEPTLKIL